MKRTFVCVLTTLLSMGGCGLVYAVTPCTIVVGASFASDEWMTVFDSEGAVQDVSRNALLEGDYVGLCRSLRARVQDTNRKIACPAVAGSMSVDFVYPFGLYTLSAPGYVAQFQEGVRACTWDGLLLADSLVVTLANDGPGAIPATQHLVDLAIDAGITRVIVQAYPAKMSDFVRERDTAIEKHGQFWGSVLQEFLAVPPTTEQYDALRVLHRTTLKNYPGVYRYVDFYPSRFGNTFDGAHYTPPFQRRAAARVARYLSRRNGN